MRMQRITLYTQSQLLPSASLEETYHKVEEEAVFPINDRVFSICPFYNYFIDLEQKKTNS